MLIDGGSSGTPTLTRAGARSSSPISSRARRSSTSPALGLPWSAGVFNIVGSTAARLEPDAPSVLGGWPLLPANLRPPVPTTNAGGYGYAFDNDTSPDSLRLVHMHIGALAPSGDPRPWVDGELGTVARAATMFSGIRGIDGTAWYHPRRLSIDGQAVAGGVRNPAQKVLGVRATHGRDLRPADLRDRDLARRRPRARGRAGAGAPLARAAAAHCGPPPTYDHIDPLSALPAKNAFLKTVIPFLRRVR